MTGARSTAGAALLNLTGLSLGYAYLGRWVRAGVHLALTIGIVVLAALTGIAALPWVWRAVAVGWLGWMALDAARLARRTPRPGPRIAPVVAGAVAVLAVVGASVGYGVAGHAVYVGGVDAMGQGDCAGAAAAFDRVTGPFVLTFGRDVADARDRRTECGLYRAAGQGDLPVRIDAYQAFLADHGSSPLRPFADEELGTAQLALVEQERAGLAGQVGDARAAATRTAFEALLSVRRELASTRAAGRVPQAMDGVAAAAAAGPPCDTLPALDYLVTLSESETGGVVAGARAARARALLGCGLDRFRNRDFPGSHTLMTALTDDYPADPGVPQAKAVLLAAAVAAKTPDPIPVPAPLDRQGSLRVVFFNITSAPMTITVTGASAAELTLPGCAGCPATHVQGSGCPDAAGKPSGAVRIDPGPYHLLLDSGQSNGGSVQTLTPLPNDELCVYRSAGS